MDFSRCSGPLKTTIAETPVKKHKAGLVKIGSFVLLCAASIKEDNGIDIGGCFVCIPVDRHQTINTFRRVDIMGKQKYLGDSGQIP